MSIQSQDDSRKEVNRSHDLETDPIHFPFVRYLVVVAASARKA